MFRKRNSRRRNRHPALVVINKLFYILIISFLGYATWLNSGNLISAVSGAAFLLLLLFAFEIKGAVQRSLRAKRYRNSDIVAIDHMSGQDFEEYLKAHFEKQGYTARITPATNDFGADLILKRDGECIAVQAKRHKSKIGNKAVQEIIGSLAYYAAHRGMVITNSYYTANAKELAAANKVELWDRDKLKQVFKIKSDNEG